MGLEVGIVMLLYGMLGPGTSLMAFVDIKSFVIVIVGSFVALLVSFSMNEIKSVGSYMNVVLRDTNRDKIAFITQIINLSKKS